MNNNITVSAPGKLMLFGEHAVVYNRPCLVTAVNQRMKVTVERLETPDFILEAPDVNVLNYKKPLHEIGKGDIPKGAKFVEVAVKNFLEFAKNEKILRQEKLAQDDNFGIKIVTKSEFSSKFGFGSSSASTVSVIKALSELTNKKLSNQQLFDLSYKTILEIQGKGSGFDIAVAIFGGTLYFVKGGKIIRPLKIKTLPLLVAYSGVKADTVTLMDQVKILSEKQPKIIKRMYNTIGFVVELAKKSLIKKDWQTVGELMNINQGYLEGLGVSSKMLSDMIYAVRENGGYGAKLSGAGGGDCIIGLAPDAKITAIKKAIKNAGGEFLSVKTNAEGVRIENE